MPVTTLSVVFSLGLQLLPPAYPMTLALLMPSAQVMGAAPRPAAFILSPAF
jgi:hypothetical protein